MSLEEAEKILGIDSRMSYEEVLKVRLKPFFVVYAACSCRTDCIWRHKACVLHQCSTAGKN